MKFELRILIKIKETSNYIHLACFLTKLITFFLFFLSLHILRNPPDIIPAGVFPLKLKKYFTNWQEVVHFN